MSPHTSARSASDIPRASPRPTIARMPSASGRIRQVGPRVRAVRGGLHPVSALKIAAGAPPRRTPAGRAVERLAAARGGQHGRRGSSGEYAAPGFEIAPGERWWTRARTWVLFGAMGGRGTRARGAACSHRLSDAHGAAGRRPLAGCSPCGDGSGQTALRSFGLVHGAARRRSTSAASSLIASRVCSSESLSRRVTVLSSIVWWSTVTPQGVPISSWRR